MTTPGWQPSPPAPPKRGHGLRTTLIIVGVVLVLCCAGAGVGGFFLVRGVQNATAPARQATDRFVTDLETKNLTGAYELLCSDARDEFTATGFADGVTAQPAIQSHEITRVYVNNSNGTVTARVTAELTTAGGFVDTHTFTLRKEGGAWKICGRPY